MLELVANGYSAKEVANNIGIAPRTVERHIENVRLKMRARNRAHMVTQAVLAGYLKISKPEPEKSAVTPLFAKDQEEPDRYNGALRALIG